MDQEKLSLSQSLGNVISPMWIVWEAVFADDQDRWPPMVTSSWPEPIGVSVNGFHVALG